MSELKECVCGKECKGSAGLSAHQRYCDEYQDEESDEGDSTHHTVSTCVAEAESSEVHEAVFERDGYECRLCESEESLKAHMLDPSGEDEPANLRTLCESCDEELSGVTPISKKTEIGR